MSRVSTEPHHDRTGTASALLVSSGQSPTLMKNSTSGTLTFIEDHGGPTVSNATSQLKGGDRRAYLPGEREQHLIREHLEVGVLPQRAAVQPVVDDGVVDEASSVGEPARHFLSEPLQVDRRERFEVRRDLRLLGGTPHGAPPHGGLGLRAVAVFVIDRT